MSCEQASDVSVYLEDGLLIMASIINCLDVQKAKIVLLTR